MTNIRLSRKSGMQREAAVAEKGSKAHQTMILAATVTTRFHTQTATTLEMI